MNAKILYRSTCIAILFFLVSLVAPGPARAAQLVNETFSIRGGQSKDFSVRLPGPSVVNAEIRWRGLVRELQVSFVGSDGRQLGSKAMRRTSTDAGSGTLRVKVRRQQVPAMTVRVKNTSRGTALGRIRVSATSLEPDEPDEPDEPKIPIPDIKNLKLVIQPQRGMRISGLTHYKRSLWASLSHGKGRLATWAPGMRGWKLTTDDQLHAAVRNAAGSYGSPSGLCFYRGNLYIGGSYGDSIGVISPKDGWTLMKTFPGKHKDDENSQAYAAMAPGRNCVWIAWHWYKYDYPEEKTQRLLKMVPDTGKIIGDFPLSSGDPKVPSHGLAYGGYGLWHIKDQQLSGIDTSAGTVKVTYRLPQIKRPFGLASYQKSLWIAEDNGALWQLPFKSRERRKRGRR